MKLTKQKFVELLGNPTFWATNNNGESGFVHYEALPNTENMHIGYCVNKIAAHHYSLAAFLQKDDLCEFLTVIEIKDDGKDVNIIAVYENGEKIDMRNTDVVNRAVGKMALQFDYINALSAQQPPQSKQRSIAL